MNLKDALIASLKSGKNGSVFQLLDGTLEKPTKIIIWDWIKYPWENKPWFATNVGDWSERWMEDFEFKNEDNTFKDNFYPVPKDYDNWVANWANNLKINKNQE